MPDSRWSIVPFIPPSKVARLVSTSFNRAIPNGELDAFTDDLAHRIARLAPGVIQAAKTAIDALSPPMLAALKVHNDQLVATFGRAAAGDLTRIALAAGAQTREGECGLEDLPSRLASQTGVGNFPTSRGGT